MINLKKLTTELKQSTHFWVEAEQGEAWIGHVFFVVRMPLAQVPEFCRPDHDGKYVHVTSDTDAGLQPGDLSVKAGWGALMEGPSGGALTLTERVDLVERSKYHVLTEDDGTVHWLSRDFISLVRGKVRYELGSKYAIRVYAPGEKLPIAILSERIEQKR